MKGKTKKPRIQFLQAIAEVLECSTTDLLGFSVSPLPPSLAPEGMRGKRKLLLEDLDLMQECAFVLLDLLKKQKSRIAIENYFDSQKNRSSLCSMDY